MRKKFLLLAGATALALPLAASAQVVYSDSFDTNTGANYTVNSSGGNNAATFGFDYSSVGIPAAPNSGGTTSGLKLEANYLNSNDATEIFSGISVSPTGLSVTGDFDVTFDVWQNSIGPFTGTSGDGGSGSTQVTTYGWGTAGTSAQWAGARDSVVFGTTGDANSTSDWRVYPNALPPTTSPPYVANPADGNVQSNAHPYYAENFPGIAPPAAQAALFPSQTGAPQDGATAFDWHEITIQKRGETLTWLMDDLAIANVDLTTVGTLGGSNILFGQSDINSTASTDANARSLLFGVIDNVVVTQVPEPASLSFLALGAAALMRRRRQA